MARPGEPFSRFFPSCLLASGRSETKGVYDDLEDVRDARKYIAPESSPGDRKGERYRSADTQRATPEIRCLDAERIGKVN